MKTPQFHMTNAKNDKMISKNIQNTKPKLKTSSNANPWPHSLTIFLEARNSINILFQKVWINRYLQLYKSKSQVKKFGSLTFFLQSWPNNQFGHFQLKVRCGFSFIIKEHLVTQRCLHSCHFDIWAFNKQTTLISLYKQTIYILNMYVLQQHWIQKESH